MRRRKHNRPRGRDKSDPRTGVSGSRNQSKYCGNNDTCPGCSVSYGNFKTGLTYRDVWMMFWTPEETPEDEWQRKSRGVILGKWFETKQELWRDHIEHCGEEPDETDLVPFDEEDMSDVPF